MFYFIYPSAPIYDGSFVRDGINVVAGVSGFVGRDEIYGRVYQKWGTQVNVKLGYNPVYLIERSLFIRPLVDVEPYLNLSGTLRWYSGDKTGTDVMPGIGVGLKVASHTRAVRIGADLHLSTFFGSSYFERVIYTDVMKAVMGFGYPEVLSIGMGIGGHGYRFGCRIFFCYYLADLSLHHGKYFASVSLIMDSRVLWYEYRLKVRRGHVSIGTFLK